MIQFRDILAGLKQPLDYADTQNDGHETDARVYEIGRSCSRTIQRLLDSIGQLKTNSAPNTLNAFRTAIKAMIKRNQILQLQKDVEFYQRVLHAGTLLSIE